MKKQVTKFCLTMDGENTKVEIEGVGVHISALIAAVMEEDSRIKDFVVNAVLAVIFKEVSEGRGQDTDGLQEMLKSMNIGLV